MEKQGPMKWSFEELRATVDQLKEHECFIATDCKTVEEFLDKYYKHDRFWGRGEEYAGCLISSHQHDVLDYGYDLISRHDCVLGRAAYFVPKEG